MGDVWNTRSVHLNSRIYIRFFRTFGDVFSCNTTYVEIHSIWAFVNADGVFMKLLDVCKVKIGNV